MKRGAILSLLFILAGIGIMFAQEDKREARRRARAQKLAMRDTLKARYPVSQPIPQSIKDIDHKALNLRSPQNIVTDTIYNDKDSSYTFRTRLGQDLIGTPIMLKQEEYTQWHLSQSIKRYFREKNQKEYENALGKDKFDFTDMHFDLGPAEKIFGPGGVRIKTNGSAEMKIGYSMQTIDNPSLPQRSRKTNSFDFDEKINLNIKGSVGDKMNLNLDYDIFFLPSSPPSLLRRSSAGIAMHRS